MCARTAPTEMKVRVGLELEVDLASVLVSAATSTVDALRAALIGGHDLK